MNVVKKSGKKMRKWLQNYLVDKNILLNFAIAFEAVSNGKRSKSDPPL